MPVHAANSSSCSRFGRATGAATSAIIVGRQSSAILVVPASGEAWERVIELRVEDHPEPLIELRRLVDLDLAYKLASEGDRCVGHGDMDGAAAKYVAAWEISEEAIELRYWAALALIHRGEEERGAAMLRETLDRHRGWTVLLSMMTPADGPGVAAARRLLEISPGS